MVIPKLVLIPLIVLAIAQVIKFIILGVKGEFRWSALQEYGGMPSAHTAFVVALTTVIWRQEGVASASFALSFVFSVIIIRDAIGLRRFLGLHGKTLNLLIRELPLKEERKFPTHLVEHLGHTPLQAVIGGLIGFISALLLNGWIPSRW